MLNQGLVIVHGDTTDVDIFVNLNGAPVDLTGCSFWLTAKTSFADADPGIGQLTSPAGGIAIVDAARGKIRATIPASWTSGLSRAQTLTYVYDVQMKDGSGGIRTLSMGTLSVVPDVTISTS